MSFGGGYSVMRDDPRWSRFRLNTGFKSAMIVTEDFSLFNGFEPCQANPKTLSDTEVAHMTEQMEHGGESPDRKSVV